MYHVLGLYEEELQCCSQALEADRSDPKLWLFYGFALSSAGKEERPFRSSTMPTRPMSELENQKA